MPGPEDFFSQGEWQDPSQNPLQDPRIRAGLLQASIAMGQPPGWGQTGFGTALNAIGHGGEAITRSEEEDRKAQEQARKDTETASKGELRTAQADAATSRSQTAGALADVARERTGISRDRLEVDRGRYENAAALSEKKFQGQMEIARLRLETAQTAEDRKRAELDLKEIATNAKMEQDKLKTEYLGQRTNLLGIREGNLNTRLDTQTRVQVNNAYQAYVKSIDAQNAAVDKDIMVPQGQKAARKQKPLSQEDWIKGNKVLRPLYYPEDPGDGGGDGTGAPVNPGSPGPGAAGGLRSDPGAVQKARSAIAAGAPRAAVEKRLRDNGIDPSGL